MKTTDLDFNSLRKKALKRLIQMHFESNVGHIGGNLSCLDVMLFLHNNVLTEDDSFVLSKGHSAGALYVSLWSKGLLSSDDVSTFHNNHTLLPGHPPANKLEGVTFATGSLGHGLSLSAGIALGKKLKNELGRSYCLVSDGELNEGSIWEALMFISHHKLDITIIVDCNGLQGFGKCEEILNLRSYSDKFNSFGIKNSVINGHSYKEISTVFGNQIKGPFVIISETIKGKGVKFFEGKLSSHYLPLDMNSYQEIMNELDR